MGTTVAAIVIGLVSLALVGGLAVLLFRDRTRSQLQSDDPRGTGLAGADLEQRLPRGTQEGQ